MGSDNNYERRRRRSRSADSDRSRTKRRGSRDAESKRADSNDRTARRPRYDSDEGGRRAPKGNKGRDHGDTGRRDRDQDYDRRRDRQVARKRSPHSDDEARDRQRRQRPSHHRDSDNAHRRSPAARSRSPRGEHGRRPSPSPARRNRGPLPSQDASFAITTGDEPPIEKQKPNYEPTGLLAREANTVRTDSKGSRQIVLKYHEPSEARKPPTSQQWRLYHFVKDSKEPADTVPLSERSCWLFGREKTVVDVRLEERTASKQHAVIQFRYSMKRDEYGDKIERIRPYLIDLESKAGTMLNGSKIEAGRYVELRDADVVVFGQPDEEGEEWVLMLPSVE